SENPARAVVRGDPPTRLLELEFGPVDIAEPLQCVRAQREAESRSVRSMHHAVRAYVELLVEEVPHHRHVALRDLENVAVGGCHCDVNTRREQYPTAPGVRRETHAVRR